ncbi:NusG domain II-containing protein [Treponema sp.]
MRGFPLTRPRFFDYIAVLLSLFITLSVTFFVYGPGLGSQSELSVIIEANGQSWVYPLDSTETIAVQGPLGDTLVEIHEGSAHVLSSPCQNQTCVAAGEIHEANQWIACLPNAVFVRIEGKSSEGDIDAGTW